MPSISFDVFWRDRGAKKGMKDLGDESERSGAKVEAASTKVTRASLAVDAANVRVERSTLAVARAQEKYGRDSLQARDASVRLAKAQLDLDDAVKAAGADVDKTGREVETAGKKIETAGKQTDKSRISFHSLDSEALKLVSTMSSAASVLGPVSAGLTKTAVAGAHFVTLAGPAVAILPALAAGGGLVVATFKLMGPAMVAGVAPAVSAFQRLSVQVGHIGAQDLPSISRGFVKADFPAIRAGMDSIAKTTASATVQIGRWLNGVSGQRLVRDITRDTASQFRILAPSVTAVVLSFGNLIDRASGPAFTGLGGAISKIADRTNAWLDSISRADISHGFYAAQDAVDGLGGKLLLVKDSIIWIGTHPDMVKKMSDAFAVLGIAIGALTENPLGVLIGTATLVANHWGQVKGVFDSVSASFHGATAAGTPLSQALGVLKDIGQDLATWWKTELLPAFLEAAHKIMPSLQSAVSSVTRTWHDNQEIVGQVIGIVKVFGAFITKLLIPWLGFLATQLLGLVGPAFRVIATVINHVVLPAIRLLIFGATNMIGIILDAAAKAFGWVPGLGGKLKTAARQFDNFRDSVNKSLGNIKDQNVTVTAHVNFNDAPVRVGGGKHIARAMGGMVSGPGGPRDDRVPAMLSNGEFVVNAAATSRHRGLLEAVNATGYADGGLVLGGRLAGLSQAHAAEVAAVRAWIKKNAASQVAGGGALRIGGLSPAEAWIISRESGGRTTAQNPTSTAFGLGQLLLGNRQHYGAILGVSPNTTNQAAQLAMFRMYVRDRYGTAERAQAFWAAHGWYGAGGEVSRPSVVGIGDRGPERVLSAGQTRSFNQLVQAVSRNGGATVVNLTVQAPNYIGSRDELFRGLVDFKRSGRLDALLR